MVATSPLPLLSVPATTTAQRMLDAAICAYGIGQNGYSPPPPLYSDPVGWVGKPQVLTAGSDAIDAALLGQTDDGWAVLSIRGTLPDFDDFDTFVAFLYDWFQDDETTLVPLAFSGDESLGNVHQGFRDATYALWLYVAPQLSLMDWSTLNGLRITGHSKGAGMAFLFAALIKAVLGANGPKTIEVHGFAAPLAGDPAFAQAYQNAGLDQNTTRYQAAYDLVPFLPPYSFDLFENIKLWGIHGNFELDSVLLFLDATITPGYALVGALEYYPASSPGTPFPPPMTGTAAQNRAQSDILAAIYNGKKNLIAAAHSATTSYWPAVFGQNPPMLPITQVADTLFAHFQAETEALATAD